MTKETSSASSRGSSKPQSPGPEDVFEDWYRAAERALLDLQRRPLDEHAAFDLIVQWADSFRFSARWRREGDELARRLNKCLLADKSALLQRAEAVPDLSAWIEASRILDSQDYNENWSAFQRGRLSVELLRGLDEFERLAWASRRLGRPLPGFEEELLGSLDRVTDDPQRFSAAAHWCRHVLAAQDQEAMDPELFLTTIKFSEVLADHEARIRDLDPDLETSNRPAHSNELGIDSVELRETLMKPDLLDERDSNLDSSLDLECFFPRGAFRMAAASKTDGREKSFLVASLNLRIQLFCDAREVFGLEVYDTLGNPSRALDGASIEADGQDLGSIEGGVLRFQRPGSNAPIRLRSASGESLRLDPAAS